MSSTASTADDVIDEYDGVGLCHFPSASSHLATDPYCFLCHRDLPGWPPAIKGGSLWEYDVVGLQELPSSLRAARVAHSLDRCYEKIRPELEINGAQLCFFPHCPGRDEERPVHVAHLACWAVGRKVHGSLRALFTLARTTRPTFPLRHLSGRDVLMTLPDWGYDESPLGQLLRAVATRLPVEVCNVILSTICDGNYSSGPLIMSLSRASAVIPPYRCAVTSSALPVWEKVASRGPIDRISIETSSVLGIVCISDVRLGGPDSGGSVPLRGQGVRGIRFALHPYGLRAIRVLYDDGSISPWLGSTNASWFGEVHGTDLSQLHFLGDARRILRITFGSHTIVHSSPLSRELWNQECALDSGLNHTSVNYGPRGPSPSYYDGWGFRSYIDFGSGADYVSGITVHRSDCDRFGVSYAANGSRYQVAGSTDGSGTSQYLPLRHDERIVSVWVSTPESGPGSNKSDYHQLLMTTTLGRSYFFGRYGIVAPFSGDHRWTCLVPPGALCAGLSFDIDDAAVGASWRPDADAPVVAAACLNSMTYGKLTIASLADTRKIEIRSGRGGTFPFGALVTHSDGGAEALGDFYPGTCSCHPITTVYEATVDDPLLGLAFKWSGGSLSHLCGIQAVTESSPAPDGWVVIGSRSIVSWSDQCLFDLTQIIEEWRGGEMVPVVERSPLPKISMGPDVAEGGT